MSKDLIAVNKEINYYSIDKIVFKDSNRNLRIVSKDINISNPVVKAIKDKYPKFKVGDYFRVEVLKTAYEDPSGLYIINEYLIDQSTKKKTVFIADISNYLNGNLFNVTDDLDLDVSNNNVKVSISTIILVDKVSEEDVKAVNKAIEDKYIEEKKGKLASILNFSAIF